MKKILTIALSLLFILTATGSFFAAELPEESKDLSVVYENSCDGVTVPISEGKASGELPDGTGFSAENLPENAVTLRVYPVQPDEKEVKKWVEDSLAEELDASVTYYVACIDSNGKEISNNGVKVSIATPDTDEAISVYSLDSTGKVQSLTVTNKDDNITFTATGVQLYPFCIAAENPGTSDTNVTAFAVLLFVATLTTTTLLLVKRRREN